MNETREISFFIIGDKKPSTDLYRMLVPQGSSYDTIPQTIRPNIPSESPLTSSMQSSIGEYLDNKGRVEYHAKCFPVYSQDTNGLNHFFNIGDYILSSEYKNDRHFTLLVCFSKDDIETSVAKFDNSIQQIINMRSELFFSILPVLIKSPSNEKKQSHYVNWYIHSIENHFIEKFPRYCRSVWSVSQNSYLNPQGYLSHIGDICLASNYYEKVGQIMQKLQELDHTSLKLRNEHLFAIDKSKKKLSHAIRLSENKEEIIALFAQLKQLTIISPVQSIYLGHILANIFLWILIAGAICVGIGIPLAYYVALTSERNHGSMYKFFSTSVRDDKIYEISMIEHAFESLPHP